MISVYIWERGRRAACGHASLDCAGTYISWFPEIALLHPSDVPRSRVVSRVLPIRGLADDLRQEGRTPDHTIRIVGLDERRVLAWWADVTRGRISMFRPSQVAPWSALGWNSVRLVAAALQEARGDRIGPSGWMDVLSCSGTDPVWTAQRLRDSAFRTAARAMRSLDN